MDDYQPPPALGFRPNGATQPSSHDYNGSSAQGNDANHSKNASSTYNIPGLQLPANPTQLSPFSPFAHLWQQLQDNHLVSLASNSHPSNVGQPSLPTVNPPGLNPSTPAHTSTGERGIEVQQEDDFELTDKEEGPVDNSENFGDQMDRSESGEISEGEIVSDQVQEDASDKMKANMMPEKNTFILHRPTLSDTSPKTAQTFTRTPPNSSFHTMANGRESGAPAIPGLGAVDSTPVQDFTGYDELSKDILRNLSSVGVTFSHFHANNQDNRYSDDELRSLWSLWNAAGLPVSWQERVFYKALFSQTEIGPAAILAAISSQPFVASSSAPSAATSRGPHFTEGPHLSSVMDPAPSAHSERSSQAVAGPPSLGAAIPSRESRPTLSTIGTATAESTRAIHHEPQGPSASSTANDSMADTSRAAYLAKLQALRRPAATSNPPAPMQTATSGPTSPPTSITTFLPQNISKTSDSSINALIKQKLEAARMSAQQASVMQSHTPKPQDAAPSTLLLGSTSKVDVEPSLPAPIRSAPTLPRRPPSAPIPPVASASSPQTPTTPIPGLFMSGPQPLSGNSYFNLSPPTTDHGHNARAAAVSSRSKSSLSVNYSTGQAWAPVRQERVVINLDETDDEGGEEMDLEVDEPVTQMEQPAAKVVGDMVFPPLRKVASDTNSVAAPSERATRQAQREPSATQLYQLAPQTDLEKKLADMRAKLKAERALKAALSAQLEATSMAGLVSAQRQAPASASNVLTTVAATQPTTNGSSLSAPIVQPSNANGLLAASITPTPAQSATAAALSQQKKRPSDEPDASGEWRKKRRAEIQSDLQCRDQDLGSTAAKIAEMERQLALLHEEQQRQQEARAQLAKELEELGVDTDGMSHEEMQATKDDIEAAQQAVEVVQVQDLLTESAHKQSAGITAETAANVVQSAEEVTPQSGAATAETATNSIPPTGEATPHASPTSPNSLRQALQALGQVEPSTTVAPEDATNESSSDDDAMSLDTTDENDAAVDGAVSTKPQETDVITSNVEIPPQADSFNQPALAGHAADNAKDRTAFTVWDSSSYAGTQDPNAYEPERLMVSSTNASSAQLETPPVIHDAKRVPSHPVTKTTNPETTRESSPEPPLLVDDDLEPLSVDSPKRRTYVPYESPLTMFKAYRFHPEYSKTVSNGFSSLTYSHTIDPKGNPFCETELSQGMCNDPTCEFQHFGKVGLTGDKVLVQLGTDNPGSTEEQKKEWNTGLKDLIRDLRAQNVKDPEIVAQHIAEYRRKFLEEQGEMFSVLRLGVK